MSVDVAAGMEGRLLRRCGAVEFFAIGGDMNDVRELLFGDVPLRNWASGGGGRPWDLFAQAADFHDEGDIAGARAALREVLALEGLESRHYLQAWDVLRAVGDQPPDDEVKRLCGVVIDMPVRGGWDTLAGYEHGGCRYLNLSGAGVVWDAEDARIGALLDRLLAQGRQVVAMIGPWSGPRPPLTAGHLRLSFLCPSGLHLGQGPVDALTANPIAGSFLSAGVDLLHALTSMA